MGNVLRGFLLVIALLFSACAVSDINSNTAESLPVTLSPAPVELPLEGTCDNTRDLSTWLALTTSSATAYLSFMNEAIDKPATDIFDEVVGMAEMRDAAGATAAPDCAEEIHAAMVEAMSEGVEAFQQYANGTLESVDDVYADVNDEMVRVIALQGSLAEELDSRFAAEATAAADEQN